MEGGILWNIKNASLPHISNMEQELLILQALPIQYEGIIPRSRCQEAAGLFDVSIWGREIKGRDSLS